MSATTIDPIPVTVENCAKNVQKKATKKQLLLLTELGYAGDVSALTMTTAKALIDGLLVARSAWRDDAKAKAGNIDMIELASRYTQLRRESAKEQSGPCPRCGGEKRFHVKVDSWFCRDCHPAWGDAIEFVRWMENCGYDEALARLTDGSAPAPVKVAVQEPAPAPEDREQWQRKARRLLADAQERLYSGEGEAALNYLLGRGLDYATLRLFGLGYIPEAPLPGTWDSEKKTLSHPRQPAIVIPWYAAGELVALRYRFLQKHTYHDTKGQERTEKQSAMHGSSFGGRSWGEQSISQDKTDRTLVIVEGEINAMSIYQIAHVAGVDICSIGSETARITPAMTELASQYQHVILWADREEIVKPKMTTLPGAYGVRSPNEQDANDLLRSGHLGGFLSAVRKKAGCPEPAPSIAPAATDDTPDWSVGGIATFAEALAIQKELAAQHGPRSTVCGMAGDKTFYVRQRWWSEFAALCEFTVADGGIING